MEVLNARSGSFLWGVTGPGPNFVVQRGVLYASGSGTYSPLIIPRPAIFSHSATTGVQIWFEISQDLSEYPNAPLVVTDRSVIFAATTSGSLPNDFIAAVDRGSGKALWTDSNTGVVDGLTGGRHITYALLNGNTLWALDQKTGSTFWTFPSQSLPVFGDGVAYVEGDDGSVYALNAFSGGVVGAFANWYQQLLSPYSRRWGALLRECRQPVRVCFAAALSRRLAGRTRSPDAATPASL